MKRCTCGNPVYLLVHPEKHTMHWMHLAGDTACENAGLPNNVADVDITEWVAATRDLTRFLMLATRSIREAKEALDVNHAMASLENEGSL